MSRVRAYLWHHHLAVLALFVGLGGTSYAAATLPANSVGRKQLKDSAVTLAKVAPATLYAIRAQGNVRYLGIHRTAVNSLRLEGLTPAAFVPSSTIKRLDGQVSQDSFSFTLGNLTLTVSCARSPQATTFLTLTATSTGNNDVLDSNWVTGSSAIAGETHPSSSSTGVYSTSAGGTVPVSGTGTIVYNDDSETITLPISYTMQPLTGTCSAHGVGTEAKR